MIFGLIMVSVAIRNQQYIDEAIASNHAHILAVCETKPARAYWSDAKYCQATADIYAPDLTANLICETVSDDDFIDCLIRWYNE